MKMPATRTLVAAMILTFVGVGAALTPTGGPSPAAADETAPQTSPDFPNYTTPAVTVEGSVSVTNTPTVNAQQAGMWIVDLASTPTVVAQQGGIWSVSLIPGFLQAGKTYSFTWITSGDSEAYTVVALGTGAWIQVQPIGTSGAAGIRWLNTALATTIVELR